MTTSNVPNILYHYTTLEGLLGIIRDKEIWASSIWHLNDTSEFAYTLDLVRGELKDGCFKKHKCRDAILQKLDLITQMYKLRRYVTSFSEDDDLLSQWRAYGGKGGGFTIGFNVRRLRQAGATPEYQLKKCIYEREEQLEILEKGTHDCAEKPDPVDAFLACAFENATIFKDKSFHEESEWRLISPPDSEFSDKPPETRYPETRAGRYMLIPYRKFPYPKDSLVRVKIGPTPHPDQSKLSVETLLQTKGFNNVEIQYSTIPFRNW